MISKINAPINFTSILLSSDIDKRTMREMDELRKAECVNFVSRQSTTPIEKIREGLDDYTMAFINSKNGVMLIGNDIRLEASVVHRLRDGKNALDPHAKLIDDFTPTLDVKA